MKLKIITFTATKVNENAIHHDDSTGSQGCLSQSIVVIICRTTSTTLSSLSQLLLANKI